MDVILLQKSAGEATPTDEERMRTLIELLSSYVERYHGGAIEMVSFDGGPSKSGCSALA